jgi:hypothetical protein
MSLKRTLALELVSLLLVGTLGPGIRYRRAAGAAP